MGEEEGTRAAVGYGQAAKQLAGYGVGKAQLENLKKYGLIGTEEVTKETRKGHKTTVTATKGVSEERKQYADDLPRDIARNIAPIAEKVGLDLSKSDDAVKLARMFVADRTAVETVAGFLYRGKEIQNKLDNIDKRSGDFETARALTKVTPYARPWLG